MAEKGDEISISDLVQQISSLSITVGRLEAKFEATEGARPRLYQDCEALNSAPTPPTDVQWFSNCARRKVLEQDKSDRPSDHWSKLRS